MLLSVRRRKPSREGFTLLEVLVATSITLLMMLALARIFRDIGQGMKQGRAALQLNSQLRDVCFRVQRDMNNLTAKPGVLPGTGNGIGYFEYHDGPQTDYSAKMLVEQTAPVPGASRIGDVDDIIMATVRAGDIWFTGKVPAFILERRAPTSADVDGNGLFDDLEQRVSVAAQHAEVAFFVQPVVASEKPGFPYVNLQRDPSYLVANQAFFQDNEGDGIPDAYRLHYRALLVRPDLNLPAGSLPFNSSDDIFLVGPESGNLPDGSTFNLPSPQCDMFRVHGVCDLSLRRIFDGSSGRDAVAANSLQDLENPANRFAHIQLPLENTASTTMPILALGPALPMHTTDPIYFDFSQTGPHTSAPVSGPGIVGSGFLHPAYTLLGARIGEDILANNVLAFDVKGYDPGVPVLNSLGMDLAPGVVNVDDDGNGIVDGDSGVPDAQEIGWAGSDDLVLDPNDPGYGAAMVAGASVAGIGQYVDLGWARKMEAHSIFLNGSTFITAGMNAWSPLSGYSQTGFTPNNRLDDYKTSLHQSGKVLQLAGGSTLVYQPSFDTWTDQYERDARLQATRGTALTGILEINGAVRLYGASGNDFTQAQPAWRQTNIDAAQDGLDNDGFRGADDILERETSPPYPAPLRGLKVIVRMEDPGTRSVRQLPVSVEFVSQ